MTIANGAPDGECLVNVFERLLWLGKSVVDVTHVGERHGFAASIACFAHQAQRFAVTLDGLSSRLGCSFRLELCSGGVGTLGSYALVVQLGRSPQLFESQLVTSGRCSILQRAYFELIDTADF